MPRLAAPDQKHYSAEVRAFVATLPPDPMVMMMSHSAGTVKPFVELARAQFTALQLPPRSRELVILAVAEFTDCAFVAAQHESMAHAAGVKESTRRLIRARDLDHEDLEPEDRALLHFTADVVRQPRVGDEVFRRARSFLSDRELVEVLQVIGYYWSFGRIATTLDVEVTQVYGDESMLSSHDAAATTETSPAGRRRSD